MSAPKNWCDAQSRAVRHPNEWKKGPGYLGFCAKSHHLKINAPLCDSAVSYADLP